MLINVALCVFAFLSAMLLDFIEAKYTQAIIAQRKHRAALASIAMWAIGGLSMMFWLDNMWLMLPEGLGFYCGTMLAMRTPCTDSK